MLPEGSTTGCDTSLAALKADGRVNEPTLAPASEYVTSWVPVLT